jgi:ribosomal protein S18 acetylase RimI-like enzyme
MERRSFVMRTETNEQPGVLETDPVLVRAMTEQDLDAVVTIDAAATGRRRPRYFELMLQRAVKLAGMQVSLVAELDGRVAGFLIASLFYGEYGVLEPAASLETIGVHPDFRRRRVGQALMRQLRMNLGALHITTLRTEISWDDFELAGFFRRQGFRPAGRICLECPIDPTAT